MPEELQAEGEDLSAQLHHEKRQKGEAEIVEYLEWG